MEVMFLLPEENLILCGRSAKETAAKLYYIILTDTFGGNSATS